jgi:starch-binding outer membrane protein, SusD/RagB family
MKNIVKFHILMMLLIFSSCSDFLEEKPTNFISPDAFFNTEGEILSALNGCYRFRNNTNIGDRFWLHHGMEGTDETSTRSLAVYNYFTRYEMDALPMEPSYIWRDHYTAIGAINMFIKRTQKSSVSENYKKQVIGEAKYLRALFYHHLILMWGDVPFWTDELDLKVVSELPRSPKKDVVAQIYKDLKEASSEMGSASLAKGRANAWIAKALLARVALFNNDWQTAYDMAKDVIYGQGTPFKLQPKFEDVFAMTKKFNSELIEVTPFLTNVYGSAISTASVPRAVDEQGALNPLFKAGKKALRPDGSWVTASTQLFQGYGILTITRSTFNSFEEGDTRKNMIWNEVKMDDGTIVKLNGGSGGGLGYYTLKWSVWDDPMGNTNRDVHLMRLGEVYLILAEAANELNKPGEAIVGLNALRERAFGNSSKNYELPLTKEQIKERIVKENRWELFGEGLRRWYLIHWGFDYLNKAVQSVKDETPTTKAAAANIKAHHILFRVPDTEIQKNPNLLPNNPGYQ